MSKKTKSAAAGAIAALLFGGSVLFDQESRISALEELVGIDGDQLENDEDQIEAEEMEAESQPLINPDEDQAEDQSVEEPGEEPEPEIDEG